MAPLPDYHWCPGQFWDPGWGNNWEWGRCHDDGYFDGEPRDEGHWHGNGPGRAARLDHGPAGITTARAGITTARAGTTTARVAPAGEPVVTTRRIKQ